MTEDVLLLRVGKAQYQALMDVLVLTEGCEAMIANAKPVGNGLVIAGSWSDFDDLADSVAGEANHAEPVRKQDMYDRIYEKIEELLDSRSGT